MDDNVINSAMEEGMKTAESSTDKELGKLAIEVWKIEKKMQKSKEKLSEEENKSFEFLFNRVNQIFGKCNVRITDFSNQKWNDGMALLDIISVEEVEGLEFPVVGETISPLVEINGEVSQRSKVVIYKPIEKEDKEPDTIEELVEHKNSKKKLWICLILLLIIIALILGVTIFLRNCDNGGVLVDNAGNIIETQDESIDEIDENIDENEDLFDEDETKLEDDENIDGSVDESQNLLSGAEINSENISGNFEELVSGNAVASEGEDVNQLIDGYDEKMNDSATETGQNIE